MSLVGQVSKEPIQIIGWLLNFVGKIWSFIFPGRCWASHTAQREAIIVMLCHNSLPQTWREKSLCARRVEGLRAWGYPDFLSIFFGFPRNVLRISQDPPTFLGAFSGFSRNLRIFEGSLNFRGSFYRFPGDLLRICSGLVFSWLCLPWLHKPMCDWTESFFLPK